MKELVEQLTRIGDELAKQNIDRDHELWTGDEVATYLKVGKRHFMERLAPNPSFPKAIRIPSLAGGSSNPRWLAAEVMSWVERQR